MISFRYVFLVTFSMAGSYNSPHSKASRFPNCQDVTICPNQNRFLLFMCLCQTDMWGCFLDTEVIAARKQMPKGPERCLRLAASPTQVYIYIYINPTTYKESNLPSRVLSYLQTFKPTNRTNILPTREN